MPVLLDSPRRGFDNTPSAGVLGSAGVRGESQVSGLWFRGASTALQSTFYGGQNGNSLLLKFFLSRKPVYCTAHIFIIYESEHKKGVWISRCGLLHVVPPHRYSLLRLPPPPLPPHSPFLFISFGTKCLKFIKCFMSNRISSYAQHPQNGCKK